VHIECSRKYLSLATEADIIRSMDAIEETLSRAVDKIYPSREALVKVLRSGKKIKLYQGFDPSGIQLHIGHLTGLMKLRQFQKLGHQVIFLVGDGTGQAGDPSGKSRTRDKFLNREELRENARDYVLQASKIIDFEGENKAEILYNGDWLNRLSLPELLEIAGHFTLQQLEERDMYIERKNQGIPINFREFLYPLLQGYDSVAMEVDLEIGGTDQTFNMLCGRQLVKDYLKKEKFVLTTPLLTDASGKKIGKTEGNVIALTSIPEDLYGLIMNLPDTAIINSFYYITDLPLKEQMEDSLDAGDNPMKYKKQLAFRLTRMLNSEKEALAAQAYFEAVFQKRSESADIPEFKIDRDNIPLTELLLTLNMVKSKGEAKRLIREGAVDVDRTRIKDEKYSVAVTDGRVIRTGKHKFVRLRK